MMWWSLALAGTLELGAAVEVTAGGVDPVAGGPLSAVATYQDCPGGRWTTVSLGGGYAGSAGRLLLDQRVQWIESTDGYTPADVGGADPLAGASLVAGCDRPPNAPWWAVSQRIDAYTWSGGSADGRLHAGESTVAVDTGLVVQTASAIDVVLPVRIRGSALGAEAFGDVVRTEGRAAYAIDVALTGGSSVAESYVATATSVSVIPDLLSVDQVVNLEVSLPEGFTTWGLVVDIDAAVSASAVGAGLGNIIVGASTALGDVDITVGPMTLADGSPLPDGISVAGDGGDPVYVDTRSDCDGDGMPDDPTVDTDGDGVFNACDVCPDVPDPGQEDEDRNRVGDACDTCDGVAPPLPWYPDFSCPKGLVLGGDALVELDGDLRLVRTNTSFRVGTMWFERPVPVGDRFSTEFTVDVTEPRGITDRTGANGADGVAFVIRGTSTGIGGAGASMGYGGLSNVVVVEYDDYANPHDPAGVHIGIMGAESGGVSVNHASSALADPVIVDDRTGQGPFVLGIDYDGAVLSVSLDGEPVTSVEIDLVEYLGLEDGQAFVGIVAGNGSASEDLDIVEWYWEGFSSDCDDDGVPDACELSCDAWQGTCRMPGCGLEQDCNADGLPDSCDPGDCDGDGIVDECQDFEDCNDNDVPDACEALTDTDRDGTPNVCDTWPNDALDDPDGDGVATVIDVCPMLYDPGQENADGDRHGDACDICPDDASNRDTDGDYVCDAADVCPLVADPEQPDADEDGIGDRCDLCPATFDDGADGDEDGIPDACDVCPTDPVNTDRDFDGLCDTIDTCPDFYDPDNLDTDEDGVGNGCDVCPRTADPEQRDRDADGLGDACDVCPLDVGNNCDDPVADADDDGIPDTEDTCPGDADPTNADADRDGVGDVCDPCPSDPEDDCDDDTEPDTDADTEPEEPDTDADVDTDTAEDSGSCGCQQTPSPLAGWVLLPLLVLIRRRSE